MTDIQAHARPHDHSQSHDNQHDHDHDHDHHHHSHDHGSGVWATIASALHLPGYAHKHEQPTASDALYSNELGIRTVKWAFVILGLTTAVQAAIYLSSGSVALLADTVHNLGDALNSLPLWLAFILMRHAPKRRYTYGYGRAEDLAGLVIVASIAFSAGYILWESVQKLMNPEPLANLAWIAGAAIIGFIGNEAVALLQIRVGQQIGSEAMVADGRHARIDGLTSLAVLIAVIGTWLGFPIVDPIIGLIIGVAIVFIARDATVAVYHRLMDTVDPELLDKAEQVLASHPEIKKVVRVQMRWIGHRLHSDIVLGLDDHLPLTATTEITDHIRHHLLHDLPHLSDVLITVVPANSNLSVFGDETAHHHS